MSKLSNMQYTHFTLALLLLSTFERTSASPIVSSDIPTDELIDLSQYGESIFGYPDNETGRYLAQYGVHTVQNPEELGSYLEGDIMVPKDHQLTYRNGMLAYSARWPGAVVPYEISGIFSSGENDILAHAFNEYHSKTCIRFKPRTTERDYISITNDPTGCWSSLGRLGGRQVVNLQSPLCMRTYGTAIHELMHALGFFHEQNRHERDSYVKVLSENVKPGMMFNFQKSSPRVQYGYGVEYDYASVMHYSATSFSKNGKPTIMALRQTPESKMMGQRYGFSKGDVQKINTMYRCKLIKDYSQN